VLAAAAPHGLTALTPSSTRVGVAGYTLGGGLGLLGRRYGFAADHLRRLRLVTADGRPHEIDADRAPELHWALRGAGRTGFGVVTELEFALFPLTRLYGGGIVWPAAAAADVLHAWREWAPTLPDEAGTSVALLRVPRDAGWPAPLHDRTVVHVRFTGADVDAVSGDALLAALRTVGTPLLDEVGELSLTATDAVHRDPAAPAPVHDGGAALRELPAQAVDALLAAADVDVASPLTTVELRALGGALGRAPALPAAVAGRGAAYALHVQGRLVEPVAADVPDAVATLLDAVEPWSLGAALPTFAGAGEPTELWSPRDRARLRLLRQAVDPNGMFAAPSPP
jgi:FAD/FMN-containing dehydrogenase